MEMSTCHFQYRGQYIVKPSETGLMFIDQHRAHIRILHDRYLAQMADTPLPSQRLLFPEILQLTAADTLTLETLQPQLSQLGFEVNDLGTGSVAVAALPSGLEGIDPQHLLLDLLAAGTTSEKLPAEQIRGRLALALARAAAIPTGQVLSPFEMHDISDQLFATSDPNHTPDGHTIVAILPQDTIDKLFK
jgi:DNA mismatch repair protein MutL